MVAYPTAPLVVYNVKGALLIPGEMLPEEALGLFFISASVRSHVTGKEKESPAANGPWGKLALLASKKPSPRTSPSSAVMGTLAVQLRDLVTFVPRATWPKSTGDVQFRGRLTGAPRP